MSETATSPNASSADGTYQYRWLENELWHSTFFVVRNGEIYADTQCPAAQFRTFNQFCRARMAGGWAYRDRCIEVLPEGAE